MQGGLIVSILVVLPLTFLITNTHVDASDPPTSSTVAEEQIYIVYTSNIPQEGQDPKAHYIEFLSKVLGSEKAAKDALLYAYGIIPGFAAKLSPDQALLLKKQQAVLSMDRQRKYHLNDRMGSRQSGYHLYHNMNA